MGKVTIKFQAFLNMALILSHPMDPSSMYMPFFYFELLVLISIPCKGVYTSPRHKQTIVLSLARLHGKIGLLLVNSGTLKCPFSAIFLQFTKVKEFILSC